ncbi:S1 family peptidase [Pseudomarimonas salicorniae]|uniref:Serine protease n=1 Tax=Pseudomarimonas salicorniae TaxID=2933270 RepID=A0ABT0GG25_9GAMM|nr:serine protease [Lysobacter sp. CAU 1642]MCK7593398.1 serine protease [Lysobacter sp. CAU 1642]
MHPLRRLAGLLLAALLPAAAQAQGVPATEQVFAAARASLLQIRTLVGEGGRQASIGSGFLVDAGGLAVTNYHVVSQYALEPSSYRLEYLDADGERGTLQLLAFDVAADLAVVRLPPAEAPRPHLSFDPRALDEAIAKGERLWSIGNPLDLGFTIVEGNHNGRVDKSYTDRVHFSGALNPGMSGGPVLAASQQVAGVNVAKLLSGELVSFLVPARFAAALVERARSEPPVALAEVREEIARQLLAWQDRFFADLAGIEWSASTFGDYQVQEPQADWFSCWASTNADDRPRPRVLERSSQCVASSDLFISGEQGTGLLQVAHSHLRSRELNAAQFSAFLTQRFTIGSHRGTRRNTGTRCVDGFVAASADAPELKTVWCAQAYKDFPGIYDIELLALTRDSSKTALLSRLAIRGTSYENGLREGRRFLEGIAWKR